MNQLIARVLFVVPMLALASFARVAPAAPVGVLCKFVVFFTATGMSTDCLNPCTPSCGYTIENTPDGRGTTCACDGAVPICCHIVMIDLGGGVYDYYGSGACKSQESPCPAGDTCSPVYGFPDPDTVIITSACDG